MYLRPAMHVSGLCFFVLISPCFFVFGSLVLAMAAWSEACRAQRGLVIATPAAQLHYLQRFLNEPLVGKILPFAAHTPVPVPLHAWFRWHGAVVQWVEDPADLAAIRRGAFRGRFSISAAARAWRRTRLLPASFRYCNKQH